MSQNDRSDDGYSFGDVVIDRRNFRVLKGGQAKRITPRAFEVLIYLVQHPARVVGKQELFEAVWKESYVTDNALTRMVKEVRQVIGDDAGRPRYIETVPKRGYRFIAEAAPEGPRAAIAAGAAITSIAILPFVNLSSDPDGEYLSEGLTESLINSLSQLAHLRVVPRSTVFYFQSREVDPLDVGRKLNVRAIFTGRLLQRGDALIVKSELTDVLNEAQLWGEQYQRPTSDILNLQEEISLEISTQLRHKLKPAEQGRLLHRPTQSLEAYHLYLKGRYFWNRRPQGLKNAIKYFQEALEKDPGFALAYAGLADSYNTLGSWENGEAPPLEAMPKACAAAKKALKIDSALAEAHTSLAYNNLHYEWDWSAAEAGFNRALELNANYAHAHHWYSHYCIARGRVEDSLDASLQAYQLDPLDIIINAHLAWHYWLAREHDQALAQAEKTHELDPHIIWPSFFAGLAYEQKGMLDEAVSNFRRAQGVSRNVTFVQAALGHALGSSGHVREAEEILTELERQRSARYVPAYDMAIVNLGLGKQDRSLEWLLKAIEERSGWLTYLAVEPRLDPLRSAPEFTDIATRVGV